MRKPWFCQISHIISLAKAVQHTQKTIPEIHQNGRKVLRKDASENWLTIFPWIFWKIDVLTRLSYILKHFSD